MPMESRRGRSSVAVNRSTRRYGFACLVCRRKKIRCDGEKPNCRNCQRSDETCAYKASDAIVAELYGELQKSQARVGELESTLRRLSILDNEERSSILKSWVDDEQTPSQQQTPTSEIALDGDLTETSPRREELQQAELTVDEHGELHYYGATSRFHTQPQWHESHQGKERDHSQPAIDEEYHKRWLLSNSRFYDSWERRAYENLKQDPEVSPEIATAFLQMYWTWQGPLHNCVYRPCFFRDNAMGGGTYFTPFLKNVLYAHACRHLGADDPRFAVYDRGEHFLAKAKLLLLEELGLDKPRIPTIQGLLILGGRQCAVGKSSEGWLYTGMAIRMIRDLGLHLQERHSMLVGKLEPDDLEASKRLYLAAYAWDKSISLCLGRPPSLTELPYDPGSIYDHAADDFIWRPLYLTDVENTYPPTKACTDLAFSWLCRLSTLINELYDKIYNGRPSELQAQTISDLEQRIRRFYRDLPEQLRVENVASLPFCPPPHITTLNILYHTLLILLYRPFFRWLSDEKLCRHPVTLRAKKVCIEEAVLVNDFFQAYGKTFNFQNQSYLISYCVYTAATIELQQIDDADERVSSMAASRLGTTLSMLETEARQTPGVRRSVDIIKLRLESRREAENASPHAAALLSDRDVTSEDLRLMTSVDDFDLSSDALDISSGDMTFSADWLDWGSINPSGDFVPGIETWTWREN